MSFRRLVFVTLLLSASIPAGIAQLYVEGDYVGTASSMSCSATARYMSGVFNWQIDYDWFVGARAIVTGPRSSSMGESGYGIVTARAGVSEFYGSLPGGCYYFDMEGSAQNPRTGEVSPPPGWTHR